MKRAYFLLVAVALFGCASLSQRDVVKEGIAIANPIIELIESYRNENDVYPASLNDLNISEELISLLKIHGVKYKPYNNQSDYSVSFNVSGILSNPWCAYGSSTDQWQCLHK